MHKIEAIPTSRMVQRLGALVAMSSISLFAGSASASTTYWAYLLTTYEFQGDCTVCHKTPQGMAGTVDKKFGQNLMTKYGLGGADEAKFESVMAQITADGLDSDGDKATDVEELSGGGNPNDPAILPGGFEPPVQAEYGCLGAIAGNKSSTDGAALTAAALVAAVLVLKRRR